MASVVEVKKTVEQMLLATPGVVGVGTSSDRSAILVYVEQSDDVAIPDRIGGYPVEVVVIGRIVPYYDTPDPIRTMRYRPVVGGISAGHAGVTAGTLGGVVSDVRTGEKYLLSNNHVFANTDTVQHPAAHLGDPILQPSLIDGGVPYIDEIATLYRWVPFDETDVNLVDVAIARPHDPDDVAQYMLTSDDLDVIKLGEARGVSAMIPVKKYSRTSSGDVGAIVDLDATVRVDYGGGRVIAFVDQIVARLETRGGDSGSLVLDSENNVVGLLFAGTEHVQWDGERVYYGIINKIRNVQAMIEDESLQLDFAGDLNEAPPVWATGDTDGVDARDAVPLSSSRLTESPVAMLSLGAVCVVVGMLVVDSARDPATGPRWEPGA